MTTTDRNWQIIHPTRRELHKEYKKEIWHIQEVYASGRRQLSAELHAGQAEAKVKYYLKLKENDYGPFWCWY